MTHQDLVEEWKEKLEQLIKSPPLVHYHGEQAAIGYLFEQAMRAAAKGAAAAGKVEKKDERPMEDGVPVETYGYEEEYNSAISQSERQLTDYFNEGV